MYESSCYHNNNNSTKQSIVQTISIFYSMCCDLDEIIKVGHWPTILY